MTDDELRAKEAKEAEDAEEARKKRHERLGPILALACETRTEAPRYIARLCTGMTVVFTRAVAHPPYRWISLLGLTAYNDPDGLPPGILGDHIDVAIDAIAFASFWKDRRKP